MSKILVVGSQHAQPGEEQNLSNYREYLQAAAGENVQVCRAMLDDLTVDIAPHKFSVYDNVNESELSEYSLIIIRGMLRSEIDVVYCISEYANLNRIPCVNDYRSAHSVSKLAQAVVFYKEDLSFPRTIYAAKENLKEIVSQGLLSTPFIYKDKFGSHGSQNYLVDSIEKLGSITPDKMLAQEYIPNDGDYRVLIIGDKHLVIRRKSTGGSHLNNTSQGGTAELAEDFSPEIIKHCRQVASKRGMRIAGVDVVINRDNQKYFFLEINSQPQIKTGAFVAEKQRLISELVKSLLTEQS